MIGQPEPIAKCPDLVARRRADRAAREDAIDRRLELAAALVQLLRKPDARALTTSGGNSRQKTLHRRSKS